MPMFADGTQLDEVNVLASAASWAWPEALRRLFQPRGVNLMVAEDANDFVHIIGRTRIHTTIVDMDSERSNGLATIKIIRMDRKSHYDQAAKHKPYYSNKLHVTP